MNFMTTKEAEKKWNISERRIRKLLKDGRISGAIKIGNSWSIPISAKKPVDKRSIKQKERKIIIELDKINLNKLKKQQIDINNNLLLDWIYHANRLDGNSLTREEIKIVISNITVAGKTIQEHLEIINYNEIINYVLQSLDKEIEITEEQIQYLHYILTKNIDDNAGIYRNDNYTNQKIDYQLIPEIVKNIILKYNESTYHSIIKAVVLHSELIRIMPFKNNNEKLGLVILNLLLLNNGYYPIIINNESEKNYLSQLQISQITGNYTELINLIIGLSEKELQMFRSGDK